MTASSWMMFPLASRGHTLGLLTLVARERIGHFVAEDLKTAEDLAGRLAVALDHANLHQQALRAKEARDEMLACLAHDLRNPVYAIMLSTAGLSDERPSIERRKSWPRLQRVRRNAQHINSMIDDLTELSRFESATFRLTLTPHDVRALLNEVLQLLLPLAEEKELALGIDPAVPAGIVRCDSGRVYQVLSNLVGNAVKVTPTGGAITIFSEPGDREVLFSVRDTGPGLSASDRERMFEKYWQGRAGTRGGRGLGLYIAKRVVEAHGGRIGATRSPAEARPSRSRSGGRRRSAELMQRAVFPGQHHQLVGREETTWLRGRRRRSSALLGPELLRRDAEAPCRPEVWSRVSDVLDRVIQVSVGKWQSCAVRNDRTVWCWGNREVFQGSSFHPPLAARVNLGAR